MFLVYQKYLVVDHKVGGVDTSYSPSLDLGGKLNLTENDMAYLMHQGIAVYNDNEPVQDNITYQLLHKDNHLNWK